MLIKHPTTKLHPKPLTVLSFARIVVGSRACPKCVGPEDDLSWYKDHISFFLSKGPCALSGLSWVPQIMLTMLGHLFSLLTEAF